MRHCPSIGLGLGLSLRSQGGGFSGLLDQYGGAAAAYSLRALSSGWLAGDVVEVRRSSDSTSDTFTAGQITGGAMVDWVNETVELPLDFASGAVAAYSLRNLSTSYSGNVVTVRRSSDDTTDTFTATEVSNGTLTTFTGAGDGFVTQWWDQSGNTNHATQATTTAQPKIVDAGSLVTDANGKPEMDFDGVNDWLTLGVSQLGNTEFFADSSDSWFITGVATYGNGTLISKAGASGSDREFQIYHDAATNSTYTRGSKTDLSSDANQRLVSYNWDGANAVIGLNGTSNAASVGTAPKTSQDINIGARTDGQFLLNGSLQEIIIYDSDQTANRAGIESNISTEYGITLPTGSNPGSIDGFVSTWYDQSGNANNATQATTTAQPKIVDAGALVVGGLDFDGVDDFMTTASYAVELSQNSASVFAVYEAGGNNGRVLTEGDTAVGGSSQFIIPFEGGSSLFWVNGDETGTKPTGLALIGFDYDQTASTVKAFSNGSQSGAALSNPTLNPEQKNYTFIGSNTNNTILFGGTIKEIITYKSDQSANRAAIEANINDFYTIY